MKKKIPVNLNKILVTRTDKLGDVLLSLPALRLLRRSLPKAEIHFLCRPDFYELLESFLTEERILPSHLHDFSKDSLKDFFQVEKFDAGIFLFGEKAMLTAAKLEKMPIRTGPISKPFSFFLLNRGVTQRRSLAKKNEAEYNLDLVSHLLLSCNEPVERNEDLPIVLKPSVQNSEMAEVALVHLGIDPLSEFIAVHPGMGGSAINLSARQYVSLVSAIENKTSLPVVVSIGPTQTDQKLGRDMGQLRKGTRFIQGLSLPGLKEFFRKAKTVIAPSTGPLHLAHLVGTPTIGIYSPVKSQHATRWRPYGGIAPSEVIYPEVSCPGKRECMGTKCPKFFCMDQVPWTELILNHMQGMKI